MGLNDEQKELALYLSLYASDQQEKALKNKLMMTLDILTIIITQLDELSFYDLRDRLFIKYAYLIDEMEKSANNIPDSILEDMQH